MFAVVWVLVNDGEEEPEALACGLEAEGEGASVADLLGGEGWIEVGDHVLSEIESGCGGGLEGGSGMA